MTRKKGKQKQRKYWEPDEKTILERAAKIRATWSEDKLLSRRTVPVDVQIQVVTVFLSNWKKKSPE